MAACALEPAGSGAGMCVYMYRRIWLLQLRPIQEPVVQTTVKPLGLAFPSWLPVHYTGFSTDTAGCTQCLIQLKSLRGKKIKQKKTWSLMCICNEHLCTSTHTQSHVLCFPPEQKGPFVWGDCSSDKLPSFFYAAHLFSHSKAGFKVLHFMKATLKRDQGQRCVCVCEERCVEKKNRKAKNQGMLGFVCTAKKCAESREMGQSLRGFLYGWGKSYCDQGEQCVKQMGYVFVTHHLTVL